MSIIEEQCDEALDRIAKIDADFASATVWGSWMVEAANERESIVNQLRRAGVVIEHKYLARTADGTPVD